MNSFISSLTLKFYICHFIFQHVDFHEKNEPYISCFTVTVSPSIWHVSVSVSYLRFNLVPFYDGSYIILSLLECCSSFERKGQRTMESDSDNHSAYITRYLNWKIQNYISLWSHKECLEIQRHCEWVFLVSFYVLILLRECVCKHENRKISNCM